jgi:hypothetical protein
LRQRTSLGTLLGDITYTRVRLKAHPEGAPYVGNFDKLRQKWTIVQEDELSLREAIVEAQAIVDHTDDLFDVFVAKLLHIVDGYTNGRLDHPLRKLFLGNKNASDFVKPVLGKQMAAMEGWLTLLQTKCDDYPELKALAPELDALLKQGKAAAKAKTDAEVARNQFRDVGERAQFIEEVNAERKSLYGSLGKRAHEDATLPKDLAERFFLHESQPDDEEEKEPTIEDVRLRIEALQQQLEAEKQLLSELEADQQAEQEVVADEEQLAALQKQKQELADKEKKLKSTIETKKGAVQKKKAERKKQLAQKKPKATKK